MTEKQILQKLCVISAELDKRRGKLDNYNKGELVHQKQLAFHKCLKNNRWVFGGNRSGKTECGAVESVWLAKGVHPYRDNKKDVFGWIVSLSREVQRDVAQKKFLSYLTPYDIADITMQSGRKDSPESGIIDQIMIKNAFGGISTVGFKSCDQGREKFQGASLDFVWFDEEPPKDVYDECKMRLLDKNGCMFGTMTPLKGLTFIYDEIFLNSGNSPDVWCEFMEWNDNPYLDKREIDKLNSSLSKDQLESRRFGRFRDENGPVYPEFDQNVHVIDPFDIPSDWQDKLSIDPGLSNPLSCHFYAVDYDGNVYVVAEHYAAETSVENHAKAIFRLADELNWHRTRDGKLESLIDSAANQKTLASSKSVTELFYEHGLICNPHVNKDKFAGISRVKEYLNANKLFIFKNCVNLIRELKSYRFGDGDCPVKKDDHALDELRYYIMTRPSRVKPAPCLTPVQKDKLRLIRKLNRKYGGN